MTEGLSGMEPQKGSGNDGNGSEPRLGSEIGNYRLTQLAQEIKEVAHKIDQLRTDAKYDEFVVRDEWGILAPVVRLAKKREGKKREAEIANLTKKHVDLLHSGGKIIAQSPGTYAISNAYLVVDSPDHVHMEVSVWQQVDGVIFQSSIKMDEAQMKKREAGQPGSSTITLDRNLSPQLTFGSRKPAYLNVIVRGDTGSRVNINNRWTPRLSTEASSFKPTIEDITSPE
jgi:hypothetical protein